MRIAVASDLHAYDVTMPSPPSSLCMADPADQPTRHPLAGLKQLITTEGLKADLLICPGDLADKANTAALNYVWAELHQLKDLLGANRLIATAGNHDVDSRHQNSAFDPHAALQALVPHFPGLSESECDRYWARKFVLIEEPGWRIIVLNSSAYHGGGRDQIKEAQHGRVSASTVVDIGKALNSSNSSELNILLCHHHLYRDNAVNEEDYSEMDGADHLLRLLGSGNHGQWVVMHGHKHHPKLHYGHGGMVSPIVFCAGSLSASLYAELADVARNQFYILDLDPEAARDLQLDVAGRLKAWDWIRNKGWQPAGLRSGLPHNTGFGYRTTVTSAATKIASILNASPPFIRWNELVGAAPELDYMLHTDLAAVLSKLAQDHAIMSTQDALGAVVELGRA